MNRNDQNGYVLRLVEIASSGATLTGDLCFSCGGQPTAGQGEHVIPKWLQKRFGLANERVTLLNGTFLPYRSLTVPCCTDCNNGFLRNIENSIVEVIANPSVDLAAYRLRFAQWMCKIFIGLLVKEKALPFDRRYPEKGSIAPTDILEEFMHAQLVLQSARKETVFHALHGDFPFSLYLYRVVPDRFCGDFDLSTHIGGQSIAIRVGEVGAIFVNDGGLQMEVGAKGPFGLAGKELHPIQFAEVAARVHYKASLRDATHSYVSSETPEVLTIDQSAVRPYTNITFDDGAQRIFKPWDDVECASFIERYRNIDWGTVYEPSTGLFSSTLMDEDGALPNPRSFRKS
tara:strand:+ start:84 stop:1115 length:1032 start_codon:yes stop_codon:yes gene_type:complete